MRKPNLFESYQNSERELGIGTLLMPKEKWDTIEEYIQYLIHLTEYVFAERFASNMSVLEIDVGTGYGTDLISKSASSIVAIDIWREGILYCRDKYMKDNLYFLIADGTKLPFKSGSFDVTISFHTIEHIEPKEVLRYLSEIKRVLKGGGIFIISTPNAKLRLLPFQKPWNPEHKKEYNRKELENLLSKVFEEVEVHGLRGSEKILSIERRRVKQDPLDVYVVTPLYKLIKQLLPSPILNQLKR